MPRFVFTFEGDVELTEEVFFAHVPDAAERGFDGFQEALDGASLRDLLSDWSLGDFITVTVEDTRDHHRAEMADTISWHFTDGTRARMREETKDLPKLFPEHQEAYP